MAGPWPQLRLENCKRRHEVLVLQGLVRSCKGLRIEEGLRCDEVVVGFGAMHEGVWRYRSM